jgi:hypothetical protein
MSIFGFIFRKIMDWILELPPDLLGRKIERILDRGSERRRRGRVVRSRALRPRRKRRRRADMV